MCLVASLMTAGCASPSLELAPAAPDDPFKPVVRGVQLPKVTATNARDFGLPPMKGLPLVPAPPTLDAKHVYSLADLIDLAQTNNPETRVAWEQARQAALAVGKIKATYLPTITATVVGGYQRSSGNTSTQIDSLQLPNNGNSRGTDLNGTVSSVALQWLLFDFGQRDALARAAGDLSLASNISFNGTHQTIIYDVTRQFYDYTSARQRLAILVLSRADSAHLLDAANDRYNHGVGTTVEVAQAHQLLAQTELDVVEARGAERNVYHSLLAAAGLPLTATIRVQDVSARPLPAVVGAPVDRLISDAVARRPDVQASLAAARAASAGIQVAEAEFLPKVFATASGTYTTGNISINSLPSLSSLTSGNSTSDGAVSTSTTRSNATVLGGVSIPLYDGGMRVDSLLSAQARADQAQATVLRLQQNAGVEVVEADDALRNSLASNRAATSLVGASTVAEDAAFSAYKTGAGPLTSAIEAEKTLLTGRLAQAQADGTALIAAATLAFATGRLSSSDAAVDRNPLRPREVRF